LRSNLEHILDFIILALLGFVRVLKFAQMEKFQVIKKGIVFELEPEEEGGFTITAPSLPGCISYGKTIDEALEMIKDAMEGWIEVAKEEGLDIPEEVEKNILVTR
jgi:predicted RNase H-like HicB family nuclease